MQLAATYRLLTLESLDGVKVDPIELRFDEDGNLS